MSMAPPRKKQRASSSNDKKVRLRHACASRELVDVNKKLTEAQRGQIETTPFKFGPSTTCLWGKHLTCLRFPFPRFLNWPVVRYKIKAIQDAFRKNVVTENLTTTGEELQFDVVRDALEDVEHQYVSVSEYRRLVVEHQHSQERISILEADVKMLKDQLGSMTEPYDASPLIPSPRTDIADEVGDEGALGIERGNADADAVVSTPKGRHGEDGEGGVGNDDQEDGEGGDGDGDQEGNEDGGDGDGGQEGNEDGEHGRESNITTRVKENPRRRVQSVSTKSPFMHIYMTRKKRTTMQRATRQITKNA